MIEGAKAISLGEADAVLAAGVEHMTNIPHFVLHKRKTSIRDRRARSCRYGLAAICGNGGQGAALAIERV